jgi:hypothetical protein
MDINEFKARLGAGGARPNQFMVTLTFPAAVGAAAGQDSLLVTAASLPASNVNTTTIQYRGREVKFAGERSFDPWVITIANDTSMRLRSLFERWSDLMNNRLNNGGETAPALYMADLTVEQLDRNDAVIRSYSMKDAWPTNVSEIALAYSQNDVISEFQVTFQYQWFEVKPL